MKKVTVLIATTVLLLTSCVSTQMVSLQPKDANDLPVYMVGSPTPDYTPVAYIEASGGVLNNKRQLLKKLKQRAQRQQGVNALVSVRFGFQGYLPIVEGIAATVK